LAVHGVVYFKGVAVFLAVVFPPADRAQSHGIWRLQRPAAATLASKTNRCRPHMRMDDICVSPVYIFR
jgi:hypothetical protein